MCSNMQAIFNVGSSEEGIYFLEGIYLLEWKRAMIDSEYQGGCDKTSKLLSIVAGI